MSTVHPVLPPSAPASSPAPADPAWLLGGNSVASEQAFGNIRGIPIFAGAKYVGKWRMAGADSLTQPGGLLIGQSSVGNVAPVSQFYNPNASLQVQGTDADPPGYSTGASLNLSSYSANGIPFLLYTYASRGSDPNQGAPVVADATQPEDTLFQWVTQGVITDGATASAYVAGTWYFNCVNVTATNIESQWFVQTSPTGSTFGSPYETFGINADGHPCLNETPHGAPAAAGIATIGAGGNVVVANSHVRANTRIVVSGQDGGTVWTGAPTVQTRVANTSFTIKSSAGVADSGAKVYWQLWENSDP